MKVNQCCQSMHNTNPFWETIPLVALIKILKNLSLKDALNATATCTSWRAAMPYCKPKRDQLYLTLNEIELDHNKFMTVMFKNNIKRLIIRIDLVNEELIDRIITTFLNRFIDCRQIIELVIIATTNYLDNEESIPLKQLRSKICEPLIENLSKYSLRKITFHGCAHLMPYNYNSDKHSLVNNDKLEHLWVSNVRQSQPVEKPITLAQFRNLSLLSVNYNNLDESAMNGIAQSNSLKLLILNITRKPNMPFDAYVYSRTFHPKGLESLQIIINCIGLTKHVLSVVARDVLHRGLFLIKIRILFCNALSNPFLHHLAMNYGNCLKEIAYVDCIKESSNDQRNPGIIPLNIGGEAAGREMVDLYDIVNPFIYVCWQCFKLERMILHGYWQTAQDVVGMARLRSKTLKYMEISEIDLEDTPYTEFMAALKESLSFQVDPTVHFAKPLITSQDDYAMNITAEELNLDSTDIT